MYVQQKRHKKTPYQELLLYHEAVKTLEDRMSIFLSPFLQIATAGKLTLLTYSPFCCNYYVY